MFLKVIEFIIKIQQIALDSFVKSSSNIVPAILFLFRHHFLLSDFTCTNQWGEI